MSDLHDEMIPWRKHLKECRRSRIQQFEFKDCPHQLKRVIQNTEDKYIFICMQCHSEV